MALVRYQCDGDGGVQGLEGQRAIFKDKGCGISGARDLYHRYNFTQYKIVKPRGGDKSKGGKNVVLDRF